MSTAFNTQDDDEDDDENTEQDPHQQHEYCETIVVEHLVAKDENILTQLDFYKATNWF